MSSTPSTPRTTRTASRANSPNADDNMMLTPGRKIKAMMAAFDSDSESENVQVQQKPDRSTTTLSNALKHSTISTQPTNTADSDDDDDDDEEEDIIMPKGRMAARLQGLNQNQSEGQTAFERVSKTLRTEKKDDVVMDDVNEDEDEDDLPAAGPRRRGRNITDLVPELELDEQDRSPSPARSESPLFVSSPGRGQDDNEAGSGNGDEAQPKANSRFLALVAQKRKEREEKEKAEAEKRAARAKQQEQFSSEILSGSESEGENGSGRKLTQQASRPARKASKKALEEMNRETQRMSRNMQLAHQAQTKKKITKESFFARFNAVKSNERAVPGASQENSSTTTDSLNSSDAEAQKDKETPRTSPVLGPVEKVSGEDVEKEAETEFRSLEDILANPRPQVEQPVVARMEGDETHTTQPAKKPSKERKQLSGPPVRVRLTREEVARQQKDDSDSELEIVTSPAKCRRIAAFENVPARKVQEPASMMKLKALAHLTSPTRKSTMHPAQLSATVLLKAKQQAARERQERIEQLRAKGVHIETAEERAAMEDELENLVEKARKEAEDIAKIERKAAKGAEEDDEDWDYSGSEEEGEEEDEEEDEEDKPAGEDGLVDSEAGEGEESEDDQTETMSVDENDAPTQRRKRPTRVVLDDDDDEETDPKTPAKSIVTPTTRSVERPQLPTQSSSNLMSLTQAFAGTISGSHQDNGQSGSTIPYSVPDPDPMVEDRQASDSQTIIRDSQEPRKESVDLLAGYAQSDSRISESPAPRSTQLSQVPDPTQDEGFVFSPFDPNKRFLGTPQSTIETVVINRDNQDGSPAPARRMKQLKRGRTVDLSMIEEQENEGEGDFEIDASAFDVMKKASKKPAVPFDRKKSKAKEVVEEAAEESDDEYAGLGGASDEDDDEAENAYDRQMINDNSGETVDEKQLAALNALHQRTNDEKQVAKLLKDITTGALRRRRNADDEFDLDDSDDELLARRREKQREFARMRKALLADEKIGEIAENPKKAAFFRAVEDRDDDDDDVGFDFLDEPQESTQTDDPSSQDNTTPRPEGNANNENHNNNNRKRPLDHDTSENQSLPPRPPPHLRRTKPVSAMSKKPATLAEIRETLSFLTETHEYDSFHETASIDMDDMDIDMDDDTDEDSEDPLSTTITTTTTKTHQHHQQQQDGTQDGAGAEQPLPASQRQHPRRTSRPRGPVVDRLALLRQASSNSANTNSTNGGATAPGGNRMAFHSGSGGGAGSDLSSGFARPPLIRKTTSSSTSSMGSNRSVSSRTKSGGSLSSTSSKSSNIAAGGGGGGGGGKSGAVNYYTAARERERERQLRVQERGTGSSGNMKALLEKHARNRLGELGRGQWE
ncbi:hypothetical protein AbraIFM66950_002299 [Aspergillus brasiliensis]|nr:hypothetical protein AbraIFM66950_002299 [Aspergillus brasiliensis]